MIKQIGAALVFAIFTCASVYAAEPAELRSGTLPCETVGSLARMITKSKRNGISLADTIININSVADDYGYGRNKTEFLYVKHMATQIYTVPELKNKDPEFVYIVFVTVCEIRKAKK